MIYSHLNLNKKLKQNHEHYINIGIDPFNTPIYEITDKIPFSKIRFIKKEGKKKDNRLFMYDPICLDTETSKEGETLGWVYQWCLRVGKIYIGGRKPSELIKAFEMIKDFYGLNENKVAICYIHNASFDWQYLKMSFRDNFGECDILASRPRKIIQVKYDWVIFKDSYVLSQKSLEKWGKDLNTRVLKAVGEIDYNEQRFQDTELSASDWYYQLNDVECLFQCLKSEMKQNSDTIATIPLTMTGYVRRDTRRNYQKESFSRQNFVRRRLNEAMYYSTNIAYKGAYTHGNRFLKDEIIENPPKVDIRKDSNGDIIEVGWSNNWGIGHRDYRSFYPSTVMCDGFPITPFQRTLFESKDSILRDMNKYCFLITFYICDVELKKGVTAPILSKAIFEDGFVVRDKIIVDNGRILKCKGSSVLITTELDFYWILDQYNYKKIKVLECYKSHKGKLPQYIRDTTNKYFEQKTVFKQMLKNKDLTPSERFEIEQDLMKSKGRLNAISGMLSQKTYKTKHKYNFNNYEWEEEKPDLQEQLTKYYKSFSNFSEFQFGCWVTANCRNRLLRVIRDGIGYSKFIYSDTDSIFYLKDDETEKFFQKMNEDNLKERIKNGEYIIDHYGNKVEYMTFEAEEDAKAFKFLHAKTYGLIDKEDNLQITIAGVTKFYREDLGKPVEERRTREQELGSLEAMQEDFIFTHCGGTSAIYNESEVNKIFIKGHETEIESSVIIVDTEKTLHETDWASYEIEFGG